jgi:hypothetical protein
MGGTNPDISAAWMKSGITVQQCDCLLAQVYIGDTLAVITSANASINGLGLEGDDLAGWIETGVEVSAQEALPWFDELWVKSRSISAQDLENARRIFRERALMKPTRGTFADFYPTRHDFPLVCWTRDWKFEFNDDEIKESVGYVNDTVHEQIRDGLDVETPEDKNLFHRGLWVLYWWSRADGMPRRNHDPWWTCSSGDLVKKALTFKDDKKPQDVILAMHPMPPEPFDTSERRFRDAFIEVMSHPEFAMLRDQEFEGSFGSFCAERREDMWRFWSELKRRYSELPAGRVGRKSAAHSAVGPCPVGGGIR